MFPDGSLFIRVLSLRHSETVVRPDKFTRGNYYTEKNILLIDKYTPLRDVELEQLRAREQLARFSLRSLTS